MDWEAFVAAAPAARLALLAGVWRRYASGTVGDNLPANRPGWISELCGDLSDNTGPLPSDQSWTRRRYGRRTPTGSARGPWHRRAGPGQWLSWLPSRKNRRPLCPPQVLPRRTPLRPRLRDSHRSNPLRQRRPPVYARFLGLRPPILLRLLRDYRPPTHP